MPPAPKPAPESRYEEVVLRLLLHAPDAGPIVVTRERAPDGGVHLHLSEPGKTLTHALLDGVDAAMIGAGVGAEQRVETLEALLRAWMDPATLQRAQ